MRKYALDQSVGHQNGTKFSIVLLPLFQWRHLPSKLVINMRDFEPPAKLVTCAGDAGNAAAKQRWLVVNGIELSFAFYFQENS
jgi:hypothetical protein